MNEFESAMQATGQAAPPATAQPARDAIGDQIRAQVRADIENAVRSAQEAANGAQTGGVSVTTDGNGTRKTITYPDGKGGMGRIVVGERGITINGQPMTAMDFRNAVPTGVVDIVQTAGATLAICVVGFPLARAFGRWLDRRGNAPRIPAEVMTRLASIENAVETVAVEVERISEGQRFTTKLLNERANANAARDLQAPVGVGERVGR
jgi:hypothetical protein